MQSKKRNRGLKDANQEKLSKKKKSGVKKQVELKNVNESQLNVEESEKLFKKRKLGVKKQVELKNVNESLLNVEESEKLSKKRKSGVKKQVELKNVNESLLNVEESEKLSKKRKSGVKKQVELKNVNESQLNVEESDKLLKKSKAGLTKQVELENVISKRESEEESEVSLDNVAAEDKQLGKGLDNVANEVKRLQKKSKKKKLKQEEVDNDGPGAIFVSHIPHGFYEREMQAYFSQFGKIRRFRLARSSKTGNCKGFAYIEFQSAEVAKIVAEAMDNYLFFEKLLKCKYVPSDQLHPGAFKGWRKGLPLRYQLNRQRQNRPSTSKRINGSMQRRMQRLSKLQQILKKDGIDFAVTSFLPDVHNCKDVEPDTIRVYEEIVNGKQEAS